MSTATTPSEPSETKAPTKVAKFWGALSKRPHRLTSVAFTVPIFLLYHLGVLYVDRRSRADFVSKWALNMLNSSVPAYVMSTLAATLLVLLWVWIEQRRGAVPHSSIGRVLFEALAGALLVLTSLGWASHALFHSDDVSSFSSMGVFDKLVLAAGEGFHEELIFRVLLVTGGSALLRRAFGLGTRVATITSMVVSSLASALAHYIGPHSEPFMWEVAFYRVIEGLVFATLYLARGFAATTYAHAFYEALVLFLYA
jgi:hypothetical protein